MIRVFLADALADERTALRLLLIDLGMQIVGEASRWEDLFALAPLSGLEMLVVDFELLPNSSMGALIDLRAACPQVILIVLISHLDSRAQAARSAGADAFISKGETPSRVKARLLAATGEIIQ